MVRINSIQVFFCITLLPYWYKCSKKLTPLRVLKITLMFSDKLGDFYLGSYFWRIENPCNCCANPNWIGAWQEAWRLDIHTEKAFSIVFTLTGVPSDSTILKKDRRYVKITCEHNSCTDHLAEDFSPSLGGFYLSSLLLFSRQGHFETR